MIEFVTPLWFLALPIPFLLWLMRTKRQTADQVDTDTQATAILHPQADLLAELYQSEKSHKRIPWLWIFGCILLLTALSRPQWLDPNTVGTYLGHDIMLAIDISGSMRAQDYIIDGVVTSRLDTIKDIAKEFLTKRHHDRIGIIVFADDAMTFVPMTTDINIIKDSIDRIKQGIAGEKTALGDAIALAVERLDIHDSQSPVMLLLTDGTNTAGAINPESATKLAKHNGVRIYTIGIGTDKTVPFPRGPVMQPLLTELPLDEQQLQTVATETGGQYFQAEDTETLDQVFTVINKLETSQLTDSARTDRQEWYWLPLLFGLALLWLGERRNHQGRLP